MLIPIWAAAAFCLLASAFHITTTLIAILRCKQPATHKPVPAPAPGVTLVRPVCGLENHLEETLGSAFRLDYPCYEIIFCAASAQDPVVPLVKRLMATHPQVAARLLVGNETISDNPKLNNCVKGWRAACYDWIVLADSNVYMPADYIQRLLAAWRPDTGLVCAPPVGCRAAGFWAEVECAFLNTYQARIQYAADTLGFGFAQGKTMLWHRPLLEREGGIRVLASELAEDAAATKVIRGAGLRVRLANAPFGQPLGLRNAKDVWRRQVRWARLRRASFKLCFLPEILTGALWPLLAAAFIAVQSDLSLAAVPALAAAWYGGEAVLAWAAGWQLSVRSPLAWMVRDLLLPALWFNGWLESAFVWRGNQMRAVEPRSAG